jgi:hypothetical protein
LNLYDTYEYLWQWYGLVIYGFFSKVEFPTALLLYSTVISEKNRKKAWWQHHQTKLPNAHGSDAC